MDADNVSPSVSRTRKRQSLAAGSGQAPEAYDEDASNKEKDIKRLQCLIKQKTPACLWWWLLWLILILVILMIMMMACHVHIWCTFAIILIHYDEGTGKEEAIDKAWRRKNDDNDGKKDDSFANLSQSKSCQHFLVSHVARERPTNRMAKNVCSSYRRSLW